MWYWLAPPSIYAQTIEELVNHRMDEHCVIILSIASRASHATYSTTKSFAQMSHGYDRDRMPKKETTSSDCRGVGLSGYVAAIVCNRFHVDRPSSSLSSGQPCLNRPFSLSGTGFDASSVLCMHSSGEMKREIKLENSTLLINPRTIFESLISRASELYLLFWCSSLLFSPRLEIHTRSARLLFAARARFNCWHSIFLWWICH